MKVALILQNVKNVSKMKNTALSAIIIITLAIKDNVSHVLQFLIVKIVYKRVDIVHIVHVITSHRTDAANPVILLIIVLNANKIKDFVQNVRKIIILVQMGLVAAVHHKINAQFVIDLAFSAQHAINIIILINLENVKHAIKYVIA